MSPQHPHEDEHIGAVEGDRPTDEHQQGNPNGINDDGLPEDEVKIEEDVLGANLDGTEG